MLLGSSGCGKTTTLRMINRLIEPTSGSIRIDGEDVLSLPAHELRRRIGYVIQQSGLFPHRTVLDNVTTVPRLLGWDKRRRNGRGMELLELVGLDPASAKKYPAQLSGGQQQRVGVARALAADPNILLMDEPFGAVDPIVRAQLQREFLRLQREVNKTVVFVTHDVDEAILRRLAHRRDEVAWTHRPDRQPGRSARRPRERLRSRLRRASRGRLRRAPARRRGTRWRPVSTRPDR